MAPLKFRAWHGGLMINNVGVFPDGMAFTDAEYPEEPPFWMPGAVVMQSTGLEDTDGVEIYEGDILEFDNDREPQANGLYLLEWWGEYSHWILKPLSEGLTNEHADTVEMYLGGEGLIWLRVAGNRHDNPELLQPPGSINAARANQGIPPIPNP